MKKEDLEKECKEDSKTWDSLAMDIGRTLKGKEKAKDTGLICMTIVSIGLIATSITLGIINYKNDCKWRELFSSYDFVSQDGNGQNYYNSEIGGNVNNGAEDKGEER